MASIDSAGAGGLHRPEDTGSETESESEGSQILLDAIGDDVFSGDIGGSFAAWSRDPPGAPVNSGGDTAAAEDGWATAQHGIEEGGAIADVAGGMVGGDNRAATSSF